MSNLQQLEAIYIAALEIASADDRSAYLDSACSGDLPLRHRVEKMLAANEGAGSFLQSPPSAVAIASRDVTELYTPIPEGPGSRIGNYKLLQQIGEGGFGIVYMAEQQQPVRRKVALKIIKPGMDTKEVIARFQSERQALALMDHPNIAKVLDAGMTGASSRHIPCAVADNDGTRSVPATEYGRPYFVMELVKGIPITQFCDDSHVPTDERLALFINVCHAVQHAHQKGIIHRDLKPSNVMVTMHDGRPVPKVIDFGVAKATSQQLTEHTLFTAYGQMIGTPAYMSPEQAELSGLDIDTRSDVYSLGVLLYELLTGTTPFDPKTLRASGFDEMRRIIREEEPPKPSTRVSTLNCQDISTLTQRRKTNERSLKQVLRGELDWIVMKCLEKDRERRYETANSLAADLQHYLQDEPVVACPPSVLYRLRKFARRNKIGAAGLAAAAAFVLVITVFGIRQSALAKSEKLARRAAEDEAANRRVALNQAETANDALKTKQRELKLNLYRADTDLAYQAWSAGLADRTVELLERQRPQAGEDDIRAFEWFHLWQRSHDYLWSLPVDDLRPRTTFSHQGTRLAVMTNNEQAGERIRGGVHYERWRNGKRIDEFGKPIENYQPTTIPKRPPRQGDTIVRMFDARGGILQKTLTYPSCSFGDVVFSHDDSAVVFWSFEGLIAIDAATSDRKARLHRPFDDDNAANRPPPLAASPTNPWVVAALDDDMISLLDISSMQTVRSWPAKKISRLLFSPNGKLVAGTGRDAQIALWESDTGALKQTVRAARKPNPLQDSPTSDYSNHIAFSPDANVLAFTEPGNNTQQIVFWDIPAGARAKVEIKLASSGQRGGSTIQSFHFVPQSSLVAASCSDGILRFWDTKTGNLVRQTPGLTSPTVSSDGKLLAGRWGSEVRVFERAPRPYRQVNAQRDPKASPAHQPIACVGVSGTDTLFAFRWYGPIESWRISTAERIEDISSLGSSVGEALHASPDRVAVSQDGKLVAMVSDETLRVFSGKKFANQREFDAKRLAFASVAISPDKRWIATGGSRQVRLGHGGNLTIWDSKTLQPVLHMDQPWQRLTKAKTRPEIYPSPGYPEIKFVAFSPDGKQLASTGGLKEICLWSVETGELQHELWNAEAPCLAYSPDGSLLASIHDSSAERYMIKFWNPRSGELIASLAGHADRITRLAFSPDGKTLASAGYDGVRLWNVATRERVGFLDDVKAVFTSLCFSGDGKTLVAGDHLGRLHFWRAAEH